MTTVLTKEEKNSLAYKECVDLKSPSIPEDEEYMQLYREWRVLARFPEDTEFFEDERCF